MINNEQGEEERAEDISELVTELTTVELFRIESIELNSNEQHKSRQSQLLKNS